MQHATGQYDVDIDVPASTAWDLLTDWANLLRFWPDDAPFVIEQSLLTGAPDGLPRGRMVRVGGQDALETLILADPAAGRIYYQLENDGLPGVHNYLCTTIVDDLGGGRCRMTFRSMFDVVNGVDPAVMQGVVQSIYASIARGIARCSATAR